jgi:hypothetical protein
MVILEITGLSAEALAKADSNPCLAGRRAAGVTLIVK